MIFLVNLADVCNTFVSVKYMNLLTLISILCTSFSAVGDQPGLKLIGALFYSVLWHLRPCHSFATVVFSSPGFVTLFSSILRLLITM